MLFHFLRSDVSVLSALFLFIIYFYTNRQFSSKSASITLLKTMTYSCIITLLFEALTASMMFERLPTLNSLQMIMLTVTYITGVSTIYVYGIFLYKYINKNKKMNMIAFILYTIPWSVYVISLLFFNFKYKIYFSLDKYGTYARGDYFIYTTLFSALYMFISLVYLFSKRKKVRLQELAILSSALIFPIIGAILQVSFFGVLLIYPSTAIAIIMLYVFLQNKLVILDNVTNASNRSTLDAHLDNLFKENNTNFSLAFFDINNLKLINDKYGHVDGDQVLKRFSRIISSSLDKGCFVSRMGGDEFIVFFDHKNKTKIDSTINKINVALDKYNNESTFKEKITYKVFYDSYNKESYLSANHLIQTLEKKAYNLNSKASI